ncbi:MAG: peptidoglycan DD-metalloendopeptidase family protein [Acetatifactor sp.]
MRRNRKNNGKRERIVMLASSVFVLAALTMTGIYIQSKNVESKDDGYTIDFTALENSTGSKSQEIARNQVTGQVTESQADMADSDNNVQRGLSIEDDLDYMPMEAGSSLVEIPGLTDGISEETEEPADTEQPAPTATPKASSTEKVVVSKELHFAEADGLLRPLEGETLLPFSMDSSIYFSTLDQYKYNPALMLQAEEGTVVAACAEGKVIDIFEDAEIGHAVTMELGDGYELTYGQLKEINVALGSYVNPGETVGEVAAPTKYFSVEGANLYLKLTADGIPVNPEGLFR